MCTHLRGVRGEKAPELCGARGVRGAGLLGAPEAREGVPETPQDARAEPHIAIGRKFILYDQVKTKFLIRLPPLDVDAVDALLFCCYAVYAAEAADAVRRYL